ncbi:MAG: energy transducer TonB [Terracidiphilus sp.]
MQSATEPDPAEQDPTRSAPSELTPTQFAPAPLGKRRTSSVALSVLLHGSLLAFVLILGTVARTRVVPPVPLRAQALVEHAGASHAIKLLLPTMDAAAHTRKPAPNVDPTKKTILPLLQTHPKVSGGGTPKTPHAGDGSGQALRGNGSDNEDVHPSFPIFSPHPPLKDRSLLPAAEVKVVVDVKVDALGKVVGETLVKGVGNQLDKLCLDVVWTWHFQPATVNGKPVPSEAELIFPFTPSYPISG